MNKKYKMEEKKDIPTEDTSSSREAILDLVAEGKIPEEDVELTEREKKLVESYRKTNKIIKDAGIKGLYWSSPID